MSAEQRGTAMGLFEAACGVSILASGLVGGYAAEGFGGEAPYVIVGSSRSSGRACSSGALRPAAPA